MRKNHLKALLGLLLTLSILFGLAGCTELVDTLELAGDIIDILDEVSPDSTDAKPSDTDTTAAEIILPDTDPPATEKVTEKATEKVTEKVTEKETEKVTEKETEPVIDEDGYYYSKEDVALYIHTYGHLPDNFITKAEAGKLGWEGGSVEKYAKGCAIGGDTFGNREGLLPKANGRKYKECDIDTKGANSRGAKRIVFSNDGLIYYTDDHYETFTLLYGEE